MNNTFKVAKWEIKKNIRNKTFLFMTFVFPLVILLIGGGAGYIGEMASQQGFNIGVVDDTDYIYPKLNNIYNNTDISIQKVQKPVDKVEMKNVLEENNFDSIIYFPEDIVEKNQATIYYKELRGLDTDIISEVLSKIIVEKRLTQKGYSANEIFSLTRNISFEKTSLKDEDSGAGSILLPLGLAMLMAFSSMFSGSALMQSINKEKGDELVEILFSTLKPGELMFGKVIGYGVLGICQIVLWGIAGVFAVNRFFDMPLDLLLNGKIAYMIVYFLLGFVMISAFNAIAGASSKDLQSSGQSMSGLIVIIPIVPIWFSALIIQNPSGTISKVLSYIPFFTPTTMLIRLGVSTPATWEIALTIAILALTGFILIKLASKIFRVGMLMYGKSLSLKEIIKWSRT